MVSIERGRWVADGDAGAGKWAWIIYFRCERSRRWAVEPTGGTDRAPLPPTAARLIRGRSVALVLPGFVDQKFGQWQWSSLGSRLPGAGSADAVADDRRVPQRYGYITVGLDDRRGHLQALRRSHLVRALIRAGSYRGVEETLGRQVVCIRVGDTLHTQAARAPMVRRPSLSVLQ